MVTGLRLAGRRLSNFIRPNVIVTSVPPDIHADWNVPVKVRDGTTLRVNVFRPSEAGAYPVIMSAHPYGKDRIPARSRSGRTPQSAASGGNLPLGGLQRSLPRLRSARRFAGRRFQHSMEQADRQDCPPARRSSAGDLCTSRTRRMVSIKNAEYRTHPSADARLRQFLGSFPAFARLLRAFPSRGIETEVALYAPRRKMVDLLQPTGDGRSHRLFRPFPQRRGERMGPKTLRPPRGPRRRPQARRRYPGGRLAARQSQLAAALARQPHHGPWRGVFDRSVRSSLFIAPRPSFPMVEYDSHLLFGSRAVPAI